jgi:hypothetical protein
LRHPVARDSRFLRELCFAPPERVLVERDAALGELPAVCVERSGCPTRRMRPSSAIGTTPTALDLKCTTP